MRKEMDLADLEVFNRGDWHGGTRAYGDVSEADFTIEDVAELVAANKTPDDWDGIEVAILRLNDGRVVSYESIWGPTGSGFSDDAYGGDAVLTFAPDLATIVRSGLTDEGRNLLGIEHPTREGKMTDRAE